MACSRHDLAIAILAAAPKHQSSKFVFRTFIDGTGIDHDRVGWSQRASPAYATVIGILLAHYALTGRMYGFPKDVHLLINLQDLMRVCI